MSPLSFTLSLLGISVLAGFMGSLLGLGGGIVVVPVLTLLYGIDIRYAIGASIVSVIATSSGAAAAYVKERMTNLRVAMFLELGTTTGAITGAFLAGIIQGRWLQIIFGLVMGFSSLAMLRRERHGVPLPPSLLAGPLRLDGSYYDESLGRVVEYRVTRVRLGLLLMYCAGAISGLLGIGSGALKVPAMDLVMRLPIKVSSATSNFMIGVTAAASAGVYFARGDISPFIAAPVATGVVVGATAGSLVLGRTDSRVLRAAFVILLLLVSVQMVWKGLQ
ncbi:MAG: sulfite exporter TauE/SafE family protein [Planctomycetota bacterium]|nr:sulfite exporter TauE/SafE family protein [Planctomycetota bacterium]